MLPYKLMVLFQWHLGWQQTVTIRSLRFWLFVTAEVLSYPRGKTTIKLAVPTANAIGGGGYGERF